MNIEEITDAFVLKFGKGDTNDRFNAHVSAALVQGSVHASLVKKAYTTIPTNVPGCVVFTKLYLNTFSNSWDIVDRKKGELSKLSLRDFPAENVDLFCVAISTRYYHIEMMEGTSPELYVKICRLFESGTDDRFRLFALSETNKAKTLARTARLKQHKRTITATEFLNPKDTADSFNLQALQGRMRAEYLELLESGNYSPAFRFVPLPTLQPTTAFLTNKSTTPLPPKNAPSNLPPLLAQQSTSSN